MNVCILSKYFLTVLLNPVHAE